MAEEPIRKTHRPDEPMDDRLGFRSGGRGRRGAA